MEDSLGTGAPTLGLLGGIRVANSTLTFP